MRAAIAGNKKNYKKIIYGLGVTLVLALALAWWQLGSVTAATGINEQINFQGKVVNNPDGTNVADNDYSFTFRIYSVDSGGAALWTETKTLTVTDGIFQTNLGDTTSLPGSVDFNTDNIYLGVEFNSDGEMTPRIRLTASPYAFNADKIDGLDSTEIVQLSPGSQQSGSIDISGSGTFGNGLSVTAGTLAADGAVTLGNALADAVTINGTLQGGTPLVFEGSAADANELSLAIASLSGDRTVTLPDETGIVCLRSSSNCGFATGSGSAFVQNGNSFGGQAVLGTNNSNSLAFETNNAIQATIAVGGAVTFQNSADSTAGFRVLDADGGTSIFNVDTTNERVGIGTDSPTDTLSIRGNLLRFGQVAGPNTANSLGVLYPGSADDTETGLIIKAPDSTTWGDLGSNGYAEGQFLMFLSSAEGDISDNVKNTADISGVANTTPVRITTSTTHDFEDGDIVRITGTGISALDNKWWKITFVDGTNFDLDGSSASGTASDGYAYGFGTPMLTRFSADGGFGTAGALHINTGLNSSAGATINPGTDVALWVDRVSDVHGLIIDAPSATEWADSLVSSYAIFRNSSGGTVFRVDEDGLLTTNYKALVKSTTNGTDALRVVNASDTPIFTVDTSNSRVGINTSSPGFDLAFGSGAHRTISINAPGAGTNGNNINLFAGDGGSGGTGASGGHAVIRGGNAAGSTSATGGNVTLFGGAGINGGNDGNVILAHTGFGARGQVGIRTPTPDSDLHLIGGQCIEASDSGCAATSGTLLIKNSTATALLIQQSDATELLRADTTDMVLKVGTTAAPGLANARILTTIAEVTMTLRVGDGTDGVEFSATGTPIYRGAARPTRKVTLAPEYPSATLTADGSFNTGVMTSDFVGGLSAAQGYKHNYYQWETGQGSAQDYDIVIAYQLPSNFDGFVAGSFDVWAYVDSDTSTDVTFEVRDVENTSCYASIPSVKPSTTATWESTDPGNPGNGCSFAPGDIITMIVKPTAISPDTNKVRVGEVVFQYLSKF